MDNNESVMLYYRNFDISPNADIEYYDCKEECVQMFKEALKSGKNFGNNTLVTMRNPHTDEAWILWNYGTPMSDEELNNFVLK